MKKLILLLLLSPYALAEESILECRYKGSLNQYGVVEEIDYISEGMFILVIDPEEKRLDYIEPYGISLDGDLRENNIVYELVGDEILFSRKWRSEGYDDIFLDTYRLNRITGKLQKDSYLKDQNDPEGRKDTYFFSCIKRQSFCNYSLYSTN